jgi:predicted nucleotidyltransferase
MTVSAHDAAASLHVRERDLVRQVEERAASLRALFPEAAQCLRGMGATEVWAFGSLVVGDAHGGSDVDLAVAGLSADGYATALGVMSRLFPADVHLVRMERASASLTERIRREGKSL